MRDRHHTVVQTAALLLLGGVIFLPDLGQEMRVDNREVRHAEIARQMVQSGSYAVAYICGRPYIDKPPLFNWTVGLLFRLTGRANLLVARLPSAICAIAAMLGIYILGKRWLSPRAAIFAATIWATSWLAMEWGRLSRMDMMMACLILYGIVLADSAASAEHWRRRVAFWCSACIVMSVATLSKGPYAIFFFAVGGLALWRARTGRWLPHVGYMFIAVGIIGVIFAIWAAAAEAARPGHLSELIRYQFGTALAEHPRRFYMYFDQILLRTAPWGIFAAGAGYWVIRRFRRSGYDCTLIAPLLLAVCLLVLTVMPNKRSHYLLPILPMWALFLGGFMDRAAAVRGETAKEPDMPPAKVVRWTFDWPLLCCLIALLAAAVLAPFFWAALAPGGTVVAAMFFTVAALLAAYGVVAASRKRTARAVTMLFAIWALVAVAAFPLLTRYVIERPQGLSGLHRIAESIPAGAPLADYDAREEYLCFKLNRPIVFAQNKEDVRKFLHKEGSLYIILRPESVKEVQGLTEKPLREVGTWNVGRKSEVTVLTTGLSNS